MRPFDATDAKRAINLLSLFLQLVEVTATEAATAATLAPPPLQSPMTSSAKMGGRASPSPSSSERPSSQVPLAANVRIVLARDSPTPGVTASSLLIARANSSHSGVFRCMPSNAQERTVRVHVLKGECTYRSNPLGFYFARYKLSLFKAFFSWVGHSQTLL